MLQLPLHQTITMKCQRFLCPKVIWLLADHDPNDVCFQQDGARLHTSRCSIVILHDMFPGNLVLWEVISGGLLIPDRFNFL